MRRDSLHLVLKIMGFFALVFVAILHSINTCKESFIPVYPLNIPIPPDVSKKFDGTYLSYEKFPFDKICAPVKTGEHRIVESVKDCLPGEIFINTPNSKSCQCSISNKCLYEGVC